MALYSKSRSIVSKRKRDDDDDKDDFAPNRKKSLDIIDTEEQSLEFLKLERLFDEKVENLKADMDSKIAEMVKKVAFLKSRVDYFEAAHCPFSTESAKNLAAQAFKEADIILQRRKFGYVIVVDTNVLIKYLPLIDKIKDVIINDLEKPIMCVPYVVLEELDKLKTFGKVKEQARLASLYIREILSKSLLYYGQSIYEMHNSTTEFSTSADNKILEACLALSSKVPADKISLLTEDGNLKLKGKFWNISTVDVKELMRILKPP